MRLSTDIVTLPADERRADAVVQTVNLALSVAACVAMVALVGARAGPPRFAALAVYAFGLLAMMGCSVLYCWGRGGPRHRMYRQLDKAAIFIMIAGTYTPLIVTFGGDGGFRLLAVVWVVALAGALLMLAAPRRFDRLSVPLYLVMGWSVLSDPGLLLGLPTLVTALLVAGGVLYTVGVLFHRARMRFQEAIWHGFVLAGAACHYVAILCVVA
jgi:hemolysin III